MHIQMKINAYKDFHVLLVCLFFKNYFLMKKDVHNPFLFVFIISSYPLIISAAFSCSCISLTFLFKRFAFLLSATPFHIYKQKIITLVSSLKEKCLFRLIFFCKFRNKTLPHLQSSFLFHILLLRY